MTSAAQERVHAAALGNARRSGLWNVAGRVGYAACQWATLAVMARFGGALDVGHFALATALSAPVVLFSNLSLRQLQTTDPARRYSFEDYASLRARTTALATVITAILPLALGLAAPACLAVWLVALAKAVESQADIIHGEQQLHHRLDLAAKSLLLRGISSLLLLAGGYWLTGDLTSALAAWLGAWIAVYVIFDRRTIKRLRGDATPDSPPAPHERRTQRRKLARLALPMGIVAVLISLNANVIRYFIEQHLGTEALGQYVAMSYFTVVGSMLITSLGQSQLVYLATHWANRSTRSFRASVAKMSLLSASVGVLGIVASAIAGDEILQLAYGPDFRDGEGVFTWLMVAGACGYLSTPLFYALTARQIFRPQTAIYTAALLSSVLGCILFLPTHGLPGAAWASILSLATQAALSALLLARRQDTEGHYRAAT